MLRRLRASVLVALVGAGLWSCGTVAAFGNVKSESSDPSQTARSAAEDSPAWVPFARRGGLVLLVLALAMGVVSARR